MKKISLGLGALVLGAAVSVQAADLEKGKQLAEKGGCVACHGAGLNAPISPHYPKLAGQHGHYIYHALLAYQTSNNPLMGRSNAIMAGQVNANPATAGADGKPRPFTQAELKDIAAYVESLPGSLVQKK
jgi:cytochrome c553